MPRLFVAIDLPPEQKTHLVGLRDERLPARWTPPAQYHLTLRFLGEMERDQVEPITHTLATVDIPSFTLQGHGLSVFPSLRRPRVVFAGLDHHPTLRLLHHDIEAVLSDIGLGEETKPFRPHITLARLKRASVSAVRAYLLDHRSVTIAPFSVNQFHLYESILRPEGALHRRLSSISLRRTADEPREPHQGL